MAGIRNVLAMPPPQATIRFVMSNGSRQEWQECTITANDSLLLVQMVIRRARQIRGRGGVLMWTDFTIDGIQRRRYADGRTSTLRIDTQGTTPHTGRSEPTDPERITT